jgi:zinc transport system ATP-binding protein
MPEDAVSSAPDDALAVEHLSVRFGRTAVLSDVSFRVGAGRALAVIGPNGAGKTVLFRALIGAIPHEGTIRWAPGTRLGYVPQKLDIERDVPLTGLDFLRAHPALRRSGPASPSAPSSRAAVDAAVALVGLLPETARRPIGAVSGGQFQRLLIAFALLGRPSVLLLDEPTAGVDGPSEERLNEVVNRLQREQGLTVLLISHELSIVSRYATDVLCLGRERCWFGAPQVLTPDLLQQIYGTPVAFHAHGHEH